MEFLAKELEEINDFIEKKIKKWGLTGHFKISVEINSIGWDTEQEFRISWETNKTIDKPKNLLLNEGFSQGLTLGEEDDGCK